MAVVVLGGWLYEHAPGEVNCHQETISDVRCRLVGWFATLRWCCVTVKSALCVLTRRAMVGWWGQVYRGLQANAERGHAVQVIHHCTPGVTGRRGASLLDDGVLDVTRTRPRFSD
jgi:hypothetical protein